MSRRATGIGAIGAAAVLLACSGCAILPFRHHPPDLVGPPASAAAPDTTGTEEAAALPDTTQHPSPPPPPARERERPRREGAPAADRTDRQPEAPVPPPAEPPAVSVDLSTTERDQLQASCKGDLAAADSLVGVVTPHASSPTDRQKLETVASLITQARTAIRWDDVRGAANLAHKARVILEEMLRQ